MTGTFLPEDGWQELKAGGFTGGTGPYFFRTREATLEVALAAEARHCNTNMHTIHGGVIMTFADIFLGKAAANELGGPNLVTAQLNVHFTAAARAGDVIIGRPELIHRTAQLIFLRGLITANDKTIASADGIWKIVAPRG